MRRPEPAPLTITTPAAPVAALKLEPKEPPKPKVELSPALRAECKHLARGNKQEEGACEQRAFQMLEQGWSETEIVAALRRGKTAAREAVAI